MAVYLVVGLIVIVGYLYLLSGETGWSEFIDDKNSYSITSNLDLNFDSLFDFIPGFAIIILVPIFIIAWLIAEGSHPDELPHYTPPAPVAHTYKHAMPAHGHKTPALNKSHHATAKTAASKKHVTPPQKTSAKSKTGTKP